MRHDNLDPHSVKLAEDMSVDAGIPRLQEALTRYREALEYNPTLSAAAILPLIFRLKGKPFSLEDHFPQETMFRLVTVPRRQVTKAGRQVGKSIGLAASGILRAATTPYFNHLTVTPLFEQVRRFSSNYVKPFLTECSVKSAILRPGTDNSVLQRTLANGSNLFYNYASNSADRIRGTAADELSADECQDFDLDILPVIESCLDASPLQIMRFSGTPKTFDGPLQVYWELSSQAIWHIPCQETGCKFENVCTVEDNGGHLLAMIDNPFTLVCAKCGKPLDARYGQYVHKFPDRRWSFPGYHMPQVIFPMHYADRGKWRKIQETMREKPKFYLYNEILGESIDTGLKLLAQAEIDAAAITPPVKPAGFDAPNYRVSAVGVDWGGKGKEKAQDKEEFISNTAVAIAGMRGDGRIEVPFVYRTPYAADHYREAAIVKEIFSECGADWLAHDFGGAGDVRESIMVDKGVNRKRVIPMTYAGLSPNKPPIYFNNGGPDGARSSYIVDKARSLLLLCELIRTQQVLLPRQENQYIKSCLSDFLSIYSEDMETPRGKTRLVKRLPRRTDDIVHAVNFAVMTIYHNTGDWPKMAAAFMTLDMPDPVWRDEDL